MSGLIGSPFREDRNYLEGIVTSVDSIRFTCSVKTSKGQVLNDVTWLLPTGGSSQGGFSSAPTPNERVLVTTGTTYPIIIGSIPRIGSTKTFNASIEGTTSRVDTGGPTKLSGGLQSNTAKPRDFTTGDRILSNNNSGMIGLLREGTAILRASKLSQIIASKFDDAIRIIARNYDRISDFSDESITNLYHRLFRYYGFNRDFSKGKLGIHEYTDIEGDVALGESVRTEAFGRPSTGLVTPGNVVKKRRLTGSGGSGPELMVDTLEQDGRTVLTIKDVTGTASTIEEHSNSKIEEKLTAGAVIARVTILPGSIVVDYNGASTITVDANTVTAVHGSASVTLSGASTIAAFGGSTVTLDSGKADVRSGGHFVTVTSAGVSMG